MESIFRSDNQLVWMAEYNDACIQQLRKRIGPSDEAVSDARRLIDSNPSLLKNVQEKATLDIISTSVGPYVKLWILSQQSFMYLKRETSPIH